MSYKPEVIADNSGKWCPNGMAFATYDEAKLWVDDLSMRWLLVREVRVVESDEPVNYAIIDNKLLSVNAGAQVPEQAAPPNSEGLG